MRNFPSWHSEQKEDKSRPPDTNNNEDGAVSVDASGDSPSSVVLFVRPDFGERMNSLPPEVLSEIFYWCTPTADDQDSYNPHAALTLSQVCRHWRDISLSSPHLWTYTKVRVLQSVIKPALELMALYLERSKSRPAFVDVEFVDVFSYYKPVLDLFEQFISRARACRSEDAVSDSFLATHLEASSTEDRPTREEWYFWSARPALESPGPKSTNSYLDLANTPAPPSSPEAMVTLRALRVAVGSFILEPYLPWSSSLTFLILRDKHDYTNLTVAEAARILSAFPLLLHCSLHIDFEPVEAHRLEEDSVSLMFLQSFSLSWADWIDVGPLLDALSARSVRELELGGRLPDAADGGEWEHLVRFLRRNSPPLSHLIFDQIDCFHASFLGAVAMMPGLEGLWFEDCLLDDTIIRGLAPLLGARGLKTLVLLECYAFDIEVLIRLLKSAEQPGNARVKVVVDGCGEVTPRHIEMIREMGLDNLEIGPSSMPLDLDTGTIGGDAIVEQ